MPQDPLLVVAGLLAAGATVVMSWRFLRSARKYWPDGDDSWFGEGDREH
jgi:hypothetical protein